MEIEDLFHHFKLGQKVNRKKYKLMGIQDKDLLKQLLDLDNLYFTYMYLHRKDVDESIESIKDETSTDELD